jgi:hypothetical protein
MPFGAAVCARSVCACSLTGVPPCVLSFVHRPGFPHSLPSATHTDEASLWEEPCLAFVRLVVSTVKLGPAAAAATGGSSAAAADEGSGGGGGSGGGRGSAGGRKGSKAVLRRMAGLLQGDPVAKEVSGVLWHKLMTVLSSVCSY